ncbi:MAG TPA: hypothetical protein VHO49_02350 [Anaerolineales bacterium]|nr:hypothetical protein [Anaerolineales bacterium]
MADLRCPNCGKDNPDSLTVCQFCQSPLVPEPRLQIGDKPTKKTTGELEPVLPDWLRDVRQQAREAAEEDAAQTASMPKTQKEEPPDLLAGLAFQNDSNEEDVPDWLASLSPKKEEKKPAAPPTREPDFFAQFNQNAPPFVGEPEAESPADTGSDQPSLSSDHDELSDWFARAAEEPAEPFTLEPDASDLDLKAHLSPRKDEPAPPAEDLSWLRGLETEARKTGELPSPQQEEWSFDPNAPGDASGGDDLSWLNELGSLPMTEGSAPQASQPTDDLSWLNTLGAVPAADEPPPASQLKDDLSWLNAYPEPSAPVQPEPHAPQADLSWLNEPGSPPEAQEPAKPSAPSQQDLSWLNDLGSYAAPDEPASPRDQPKEDLSWLTGFAETYEPPKADAPLPASQEDLSWLNDLGAGQQAPAPFETQLPEPGEQEDLSWLNELKSSDEPSEEAAPPTVDLPHVSPFTPRQTAPLEEGADPDVPDWLKNAAEQPSLPLGAEALDQFREDYKIPSQPEEPFSWKSFVQGIEPKEEDQPASSTEAASLSNQEVDSLFSVDMPDWLSRPEPEPSAPASQDIGINAEGGEALAPADLPSWVQAMRPVEAVISDAAPGAADQPAERQGPLAGLRGVIPVAPIGSSRRPQPIPLKLQASEEQQASAALLEQLLLNETTARPFASEPVVISQRMLRWAIAALLLIVLGSVVFLRTQVMPVSTVLPAYVADVSNVVMSIAEDAPVLVILDYEPALAGELEASSGPLLDQLVSQRHPHLSFVTTSPSGPALAERLLANTNISRPEGYGYIAGQNYANMGYLPGGESGVLAFIQSPQTAIPSSPVLEFSEYAAILLLTDHAESARVWVEQLQALKETDPTLASQPVLAVASAQAGPMLRPYAQSGQIDGLVSGLADAVRYEAANGRPGLARDYWDAFGAGMMLAVALIILGGLWSLFAGMRERRAQAVEE